MTLRPIKTLPVLLTSLAVIIVMAFGLSSKVHAQSMNQTPSTKSLSISITSVETVKADAANNTQHIQDILTELNNTQAQLNQVEAKIAATKDKQQIQQLSNNKRQFTQQIATLYRSLEQVATGSANLDLFDEESENTQAFDWKNELQDIMKPMLSEVKRVTKRSRQIEALRTQKETLQEQLKEANTATKNINALKHTDQKLTNNTAFKNLLSKWQIRQESIQNELKLIDFQLKQKNDEKDKKGTPLWNSLRAFSTGRGLNILLAVTAFVLSFVLLKLLSRALSKVVNRTKDKENRKFYGRLLALFSQAFVFLFALSAMLITLMILGDWLILTLIGIFIMLLIFALRNSLPNYFEEMKTLMNLGSAREGERVIYNGLPWRLSKIHMYCTLVNPTLTGGRLRLPLKTVTQMVSRQSSKSEAWFPTQQGDFVILDDGTYGQVNIQTPEVVGLTLFGGSKKVYATSDFLGNQPRNLSKGFGLQVNFGLDYNIQHIITHDAMQIMKRSLTEKLAASDFSNLINDCKVEFNDAGASSLDLALLIFSTPEGAQSYYPLERFIKQCAVEICNEQNWSIPFGQLTVHMADNT